MLSLNQSVNYGHIMNKFIASMLAGLLALFSQITMASEQQDQDECIQKIVNQCIQKCEKNSVINCSQACETNARNECRQAGE